MNENEDKNIIQIKQVISDTAKVVENRLAKTLKDHIEDIVEPLNVSEIDYLKQKVNDLDSLIKELSNSFIGLLLIRRAIKRLEKKNATNNKTTDN